jgi:hypothetical protein
MELVTHLTSQKYHTKYRSWKMDCQFKNETILASVNICRSSTEQLACFVTRWTGQDVCCQSVHQPHWTCQQYQPDCWLALVHQVWVFTLWKLTCNTNGIISRQDNLVCFQLAFIRRHLLLGIILLHMALKEICVTYCWKVNERADWWTYGQTGGWMYRWMDVLLDGLLPQSKNVCTVRRMNCWMGEWKRGGWIGGWLDERV